MIRDFVCLNCRKKFRADDTLDASCPYCKSDNITISSGDNTKYVIAAFCFILFALIGYFIPLGLPKEQDIEISDQVRDADMYTDTQADEVTLDAVEEADTAPVPRIVNISTPTLRNGKYVFEVVAEVKRGRLNYEIRKEPGYELVSSNTNGKFENVPYSESGMYRIEVINSSEPQYKDYTIINGFDKPVNELPTIAKLTSDDVEGYLNNKDLATLNKSCRNARITISNPEEAGQTPADCSGVVLNLRMEVWKRVEVEQLSFNSQNYVTSIKLRVIPN